MVTLTTEDTCYKDIVLSNEETVLAVALLHTGNSVNVYSPRTAMDIVRDIRGRIESIARVFTKVYEYLSDPINIRTTECPVTLVEWYELFWIVQHEGPYFLSRAYNDSCVGKLVYTKLPAQTAYSMAEFLNNTTREYYQGFLKELDEKYRRLSLKGG